MKLGVVGIGRMGAAIAGRLSDLGHEVTVWNRSPEKAQALSAAGVLVASSPAQLADRADFVVSMLGDARAVAEVYEGKGGLLSGDVHGKLFIEMSTMRPEAARSLAARVRAGGAAVVECPVGGTAGAARDGTLFGFVGGAAADVARARPLLDEMCRRVEHVGPIGSGASMKLAINLPLLVFWQAFGEALSLCAPLGLDAARLVDIFADTSGGPNVLKGRGPRIVAALQGNDSGPVTFDVAAARKDLRTMIEEAEARGLALPVAEQALACYDQAAREGLDAKDTLVLPIRCMARGPK